MTLPPNTLRLFTIGQRDFLSDNHIGLHPVIKHEGWEFGFSQRIYGEPSLDESIAAGFGFCLNRLFGSYAAGAEPKTAAAPGSRQKFGSEPIGPDAVMRLSSYPPGMAAAIRKRTDACRAKGLTSMAYIGGLPLNAFSGLTAAKRDAYIDKIVAFFVACGLDEIGIDLTGLDSQQWGKTPTMRLAEALLAAGIRVSIESQPVPHPGMFPWMNGRFGCVANATILDCFEKNAAGDTVLTNPDGLRYMRPENSASCFTHWRPWLQGSMAPVERVRLANKYAGIGGAIVDMQGIALAATPPG